ncbi:hypothetical protein [Shewanella xiamenensis]|uniref:hypothetical protein n=1 Tax=Shewanella xiamenensis TaxID=332186 RepID=UPI0021C1873A|nr:hypothetical protein [Shewanella xiamenensis]MCT8873802.1 hypothetical protein [Shewanella xiamenensis]
MAVSDAYWDQLYNPSIELIESCSQLFGSYGFDICKSYEIQFVKFISRYKGVVDDNPLALHLNNYAVASAFSCLYLSKILIKFEFYSISKKADSLGERSVFYPWREIPSTQHADIKLKKTAYLAPLYTYSLPILFAILPNVAWKWLLSDMKIYQGLLDVVHSNGEKGVFANYLSDLYIPTESGNGPDEVKKVEVVKAIDNTEANVSSCQKNGGLEELLSSLGSSNNADDISLDELLNGQANNQSENVKESISSPSGDLDFSIFDSSPSIDNTKSQQSEMLSKKEAAPDILSEFQSFLSSASPKHEEDSCLISNEDAQESEFDDFDAYTALEAEVTQNVSPSAERAPLFSEQTTLSMDLAEWAKSIIMDYQIDSGVYVVFSEQGNTIALDIDKAFLSFVRADFDLDSEEQYRSVADEVLSDLLMSADWIANDDGSEVWKLMVNNTAVNAVLLNTDITNVNLCASIQRHSVKIVV